MWKWFAALEGWQRASLIGGTLSFVFFAFVELPSPQSIAFLASLLRKGWLALRERRAARS